jgi:hypothetical protein
MASANVTGTELNVVVDFYLNLTNGNFDQNSQYQQTKQPIAAFLPLAPMALQQQLAPLLPFLNNTLGSIFNTQYASQVPTLEQAACNLAISGAAAAGHPISNVTASFPSSGTLIATTTDAIPASPGSPARPANLDLQFQLPGCSIHFSWGVFSAAWLITFDASLDLSLPVPLLPFNLVPQTQLNIANVSGPNADNAGADIVEGADDFFTALGDFLSNENYESYINLIQASTAKEDDGAYAAPLFGSQFVTLLNALNAAGPQVVSYGFTQCAFSITGGNTLTFTLTHPLDAGPQVEDVNHPSGIVLSNPPTLSASLAQATPGTLIYVEGTNFPVASDTQISLEWPNTSSGTPISGQLQYEIAGQGNSTIVTVSAGPPTSFNNEYTCTVNGLKPNTNYGFRARCGDQLTWSRWTENWLQINTAASSVVELVLKPASDPTGPGVVIGAAVLSPTPANWNSQGTIPATTASGNYLLVAQLSGALIASTPITIGTALTPYLAIIDPVSGAIIPSPVLTGGSVFTLLCADFPSGWIKVYIDGVEAATFPVTTGQFIGQYTAPGTPETNSEAMTITANVGSVSAPPLVVNLIGPPK